VTRGAPVRSTRYFCNCRLEQPRAVRCLLPAGRTTRRGRLSAGIHLAASLDLGNRAQRCQMLARGTPVAISDRPSWLVYPHPRGLASHLLAVSDLPWCVAVAVAVAVVTPRTGR
jgi:hypothetical protein